MGFSTKIISLIRGLVTRAQSKVHINGRFTEPFCLEWGVGQGCPLSSILFVLSTQPLMAMLSRQIDLGIIKGLKLNDGSCCVISCLLMTRDCSLKRPKRISVQYMQQLKILRTSLEQDWMSLSPRSYPFICRKGQSLEWLSGTGCRIAKSGKIAVYLGCPIGYKVRPSQEADFLLGKLRKKLFTWANRSLSLAGRTILLKHILRAVPTYHLMALALYKNGF